MPGALLLRRLGELNESGEPLARLALISRDRPDQLERAIASALEAISGGPALDVLVVDDSRDGATIDAYRSACRRLAERWGHPIRHVARQGRRALAARLASAVEATGATGADVEAAVLGPENHPTTIGAARNTVLLDAVDRAVWVLDDDVCLPLRPMPGAEPGVRRFPRGDLTDLRFYPTREAALEAVPSVEPPPDPRSLLAEWLGKTVETPDASAAHVAVATAGMVGDAGMASALYRLLKGGAHREHLRADYDRLRLSRELVRGVRQVTVTSEAFLMLPCAAFDGRHPLPPFCATGRNSDGAFAMTLRAIDPTSAIVHLPFVVPHVPPVRAPFEERDLVRAATEPSVDSLVHVALASQAADLSPGTPDERLHALGVRLLDLADLPPEVGAGVIRVHARRHAQSTLRALEEARAAAAEPPGWKRDLDYAIDEVGKALERETYPERAADPALIEALRRNARLFGVWPALRAAARALPASAWSEIAV